MESHIRRYGPRDPQDPYGYEQPVATLLTSPYRCEITDYLRDGDNLIEVRAYNTLHNHMKTIPTQYNNTFKPFMKD